jgi:hypothetical protein
MKMCWLVIIKCGLRLYRMKSGYVHTQYRTEQYCTYAVPYRAVLYICSTVQSSTVHTQYRTEQYCTYVVPYRAVNFCNECFQEPKYEVRMAKFKKTGTKLCENQWIILQLSLCGVAFTIISVFYLNFLN